MEKKEIIILIGLIVLVLSIVIIIIIYSNNDITLDEKTIQCMASKSILIVNAGCPVCEHQKRTLGENLGKFKVVDCAIELKECVNLGVASVPTWIIEGNEYKGYHSLKELKNITGC